MLFSLHLHPLMSSYDTYRSVWLCMQDVWFGKIWSEEINIPTGWDLEFCAFG